MLFLGHMKLGNIMTELSFLIELLLNHDLPKATKELIAERIKEVEAIIFLVAPGSSHAVAQQRFAQNQIVQQGIPQARQAQSTLDAMARHGDVGYTAPIIHAQQLPPEMPPVPVEQIAHTPAAAAAMNSRHQAIAEAIAGKVNKETGRPRKW